MDMFQCPDCGRLSYNENDIDYAYCGNCHKFHEVTYIYEAEVWVCDNCGGHSFSAYTIHHAENCKVRQQVVK